MIHLHNEESTITNNDSKKFADKWMKLENIILSVVTHSQKNTHGMYSLINGYWLRSPEAQNTQDAIHKPHETQEEGRP